MRDIISYFRVFRIGFFGVLWCGFGGEDGARVLSVFMRKFELSGISR
jgi:hypothetical protein